MAKYKHNINGVEVDFTAEEEAEKDAQAKVWNDAKPERQLFEIRKIRNQKLQETDWLVISEKITDAEKTWRENLRKIPQDYSVDKYDELLARNEQGKLTHTIWEKP
mgnify:CR=1 FL=1|tara:strand:+ start:207 stop:524 length:318 start_codon:yes stop_codon:yes gene_type:complete